jgi:hypothetical protein
MVSPAIPHDPSELDREDRGGRQDYDDAHHSRLFLFVALGVVSKPYCKALVCMAESV